MRRILKRKKITFSLILTVIIIICITYYFLKPAKVVPAEPTSVVVTTVAEQNIPLTITSLGTLLAPESTMLSAEQAGVISKIYFTNGQQVQKNTLLVQLDNTAQLAAYNKDKAALIEAKTLYQRYQQLNKVDPSVLSQVQMDTVSAQYQEALATLQGDAKTLAEMQIRAPFMGVLGDTTLTTGSYLNIGSQVVAIVNLNDLEVSYPVPENNFGQVALGQKVSLTTDVYPNQVFTGTVVYKGPLVDPTSRSFTVRARVDHPAGLTPGMLIHITQILIPQRIVLAIPTSALIAEMSGFGVYQIKDGRVSETYVQVGSQFGNYTEIVSGLSAGQQVITQGNEKVQPGMPVQAVSGS